MNESQHIPLEYSETPPVRITGKWSLGKRKQFSTLYNPANILV